jgi:hypothetical protein
MKTQLQTILVLHIFGKNVFYKQTLLTTECTMYSFDAAVQYIHSRSTHGTYIKNFRSQLTTIEVKSVITRCLDRTFYVTSNIFTLIVILIQF